MHLKLRLIERSCNLKQIQETFYQNIFTLQHQLDLTTHHQFQLVFPSAIAFQKQYVSTKTIISTSISMENDVKSCLGSFCSFHLLFYIKTHQTLGNFDNQNIFFKIERSHTCKHESNHILVLSHVIFFQLHKKNLVYMYQLEMHLSTNLVIN